MSYEVKLPDLGEGVTGGTVSSCVAEPGAVLSSSDILIELETDKAVLPVPAPISGECIEIKVQPGDTVQVGDVIAIMKEDATASESASSDEAPKEETAAAKPEEPKVETKSSGEEKIEVQLPNLGEGISKGTISAWLVEPGQEVGEGEPLLEIETDKAVTPVPSPLAGVLVAQKVEAGSEVEVDQVYAVIKGTRQAEAVAEAQPVEEAAPAQKASSPASKVEAPKQAPSAQLLDKPHKVVPAGPSTRKFARELGVDITRVPGSGRNGRITVDDVKKFVKNNQGSSGGGSSLAADAEPLPDFSRFGSVRKEKLSNLRKIISKRMTHNWNRIPHVFQFSDIDVTTVVRLHKTYSEDFKTRGSSASPTNFIIKALAMCLQEFEQFNSSLDELGEELIYKEYINIGVAVDTPSGLIVPVLKDVDQMTIFDIGKQLRELAAKTRDRKVVPSDLEGASMTLSNLGGIGGSHFTPIVNWPEVAILGVGKTEIKPLYVDGKFVPRSVMQVCLSYDHRVIDGADGARFITRFKDILENVERTLLGN